MANTDTNRPAATDEDRRKYQEARAEMMVNIWREKIERLHVINTSRFTSRYAITSYLPPTRYPPSSTSFWSTAYTETWVSATDIPKVTAVT